MIRNTLITLGTWFGLKEFRFFRRYVGGDWFLIYNTQLMLGSFWCQSEITSCMSRTIDRESYKTKAITT